MSKLLHLSPLTKWMVHNPALDTLRLNVFTWFANHGTSFMDRSYRIIRIIPPKASPFVSNTGVKKQAIFALYHGQMVGILGLHPRNQLTVLISDSRDGEIIARALHAMGFSIARGSIKKRAVEGAKALVRCALSGKSIAFMVDGPRGPIYKIKPGIIRLAEITKLPIIPFICQSRSSWYFPSWDKFMGPLWGTPIVYLFGDPIYVPSDSSPEDKEKMLLELTNRMETLRTQASQFWH